MLDHHDIGHDRLRPPSDAGVSIWLDDLSREQTTTGNLAGLPRVGLRGGEERRVLVTPATEQCCSATTRSKNQPPPTPPPPPFGFSPPTTPPTSGTCCSTCTARRTALTAGLSIEVEPGPAMNTDATNAQAAKLVGIVDRPNVLIAIPATIPGLVAITATAARQVFDDLDVVDVDLADVVDRLEKEGLKMFDAPWPTRVATVQTALDEARQDIPIPGESAPPVVTDIS